eukprot:3937162-Rhodomonas_salina.2
MPGTDSDLAYRCCVMSGTALGMVLPSMSGTELGVLLPSPALRRFRTGGLPSPCVLECGFLYLLSSCTGLLCASPVTVRSKSAYALSGTCLRACPVASTGSAYRATARMRTAFRCPVLINSTWLPGETMQAGVTYTLGVPVINPPKSRNPVVPTVEAVGTAEFKLAPMLLADQP